MGVRVLVELSPTVDTNEWSWLHDKGMVPDRVPYGLDRLADDGFSVLVRTAPRSRPIALAGRLSGKLCGGARWPESLLGQPSPSAADVRLCWDERTGVPAVLAQPPGRRRRPVVSGVIWISELDAKLSKLARWTAEKALRRADAVFVLSSGQMSPLREVWGVKDSRLHLVHFGIDIDFWNPSLAIPADLPDNHGSETSLGGSKQPEELSIVSVGNDRYRDHDLLLAAIREVHCRRPDARLELVTRSPFQIPSDVGRWHQSLTHLQLRDLYHQAQVVVVCTRLNNHASGITSILEAMAMAKPIVATRTPGIDDYVTHGRTGLLVPPGDRDAIVTAVVELLNDNDRRANLGTEARKHVINNFSTQSQARRLASVLHSVT